MDPRRADKAAGFDLLQQREHLAFQFWVRGQGNAQFPARVEQQIDIVSRGPRA
jgi:hypothetical protein